MLQLEGRMHNIAKQSFDAYDQYINLDQKQKDIMFDDAISEFQKNIKLVRNKIKLLENKVKDLSLFSEEFHKSTEKLESLYLKDIE